MAKEAIVQIRMDVETKKAVENVYRNLGTSFAEAVRIFAMQSVNEKGFPFVPKNYNLNKVSARGIISQFASAELRNKEKDAFMEAMISKHE